MWLQRRSLAEIASAVGVHESTVRTIARRLGLPSLRDHTDRDARIVELYVRERWTPAEIAPVVGLSKKQVQKVLAREGACRSALSTREERLRAMWLEGQPKHMIACWYGCRPETVHKIARRLGLPPRETRAELDVERVRRMWLEGAPTARIAQAADVSVATVRRVAASLGLPRRPPGGWDTTVRLTSDERRATAELADAIGHVKDGEQDWRQAAACGGDDDPDRWYAGGPPALLRKLQSICRGCPVLEECRRDVDELEEGVAGWLMFGVRGGETPRERRRRRAREAAAPSSRASGASSRA